MNRSAIAIVAALGLALALSGCCTSLMCQAQKVAAAELGCDDGLKVTNTSSQLSGTQPGEERTLQVSGCGKQVQVACEPTNLEKREPRYREDVIEPQSRLDLKWRCQSQSSLARK